MSGSNFLLDTNAIIALLQGNKPVVELCSAANNVSISIISQIEYLSFPNISLNDKILFENLLDRIDVVNLTSDNEALINAIVGIRGSYKLRLPDAIIAASAFTRNAKLITADKDFNKVKNLITELIKILIKKEYAT